MYLCTHHDVQRAQDGVPGTVFVIIKKPVRLSKELHVKDSFVQSSPFLSGNYSDVRSQAVCMEVLHLL